MNPTLVSAGLAFAFAFSASAQVAHSGGRWVECKRSSGFRDNPAGIAQVVWQDVVALHPSTPWLRLIFAESNLPAGSHLRITSLHDGDVQFLNAQHLKEWQHSTAYFNGCAVVVELVAGPMTRKNLIAVDRAWAGDPPGVAGAQPESICGSTDDRVPSSDVRVGRMLTAGLDNGCTAWIIDSPTSGNHRCHLTAGHCMVRSLTVLQFDVPASNTNCTLVHPPASRQFAIDAATALFRSAGLGNDYGVFHCFPNSNTGFSTFQTQGAAFALAGAMPVPGTTMRVTGFGTDATSANNAGGGNNSCLSCTHPNGARNQVQQTHAGPYVGTSTTEANYQVDTCGGNSGSPVIDEVTGRAVAIHTDDGCINPTGRSSNAGTQVTHPALQAAINSLSGSIIGPPNDECAGAIALAEGLNPPGTTVGSTTSSPPWPCGGSAAGFDVWYAYQAPCSGPLVIETCTGSSFDTVLQLFSGTCASLTTEACNDDACGVRSRVSTTASAGTTYYVRVGGFSGAVGSFQIDVACGHPNEECSAAIQVFDGLNGPYTNAGATTSAPAWPCGAGGNDVWFRYVATCTGTVILDTCSDPSFDTTLEVFSGTCTSLVSLGCNDDSCNVQSVVSVPVTSGSTYLVRVGGSNGATGTFKLGVFGCIPLNDECDRAMSVFAGLNGPYTTIGATTSFTWPCVRAGNDVWFLHRAVCSGDLVIDTCAPSRDFDTVLEVFAGTCAAPISLACNDDVCSLGSTVSVPVAAGSSYWIRLGGFNNLMFIATGTAHLRLSYQLTPGGSHATRAIGCGGTALTASGVPTLGGVVTYAMGATVGVAQMMWIGFPTSIPLCPPAPCQIGATFEVVLSLGSFSATIPCDTTLLGGTVSVQGADILAPGGCPAGNPVQLRLSPTVDTTIG